jgi:hypothetical protein
MGESGSQMTKPRNLIALICMIGLSWAQTPITINRAFDVHLSLTMEEVLGGGN